MKCVNQTGKTWQTKYGYQSECEHSSEQCDMQVGCGEMRNEWLEGRYAVSGVVLAGYESEDEVWLGWPGWRSQLLCSHLWLQTADSLERPETVSLKQGLLVVSDLFSVT